MEKLAIIKDVHLGVGDYGVPALWFTTYVSSCGAALQVFNWQQAYDIILSANVGDINRLNGKSCLVDEGGGLIKFIKMSGI